VGELSSLPENRIVPRWTLHEDGWHENKERA
jgi:hypothetical protein